jgi:hypothetical protein
MKRPLFIAALLVLGALAPRPARADGKLTVWIYPSPVGIDWSSPSKVAWSAVRNELARSPYPFKHSIGHANIELECGGRKVLSGMTSSGDSPEAKALLLERIGMGVLFRDFAGELEKPEEIAMELPIRQAGGALTHLTVLLSDSTCSRLMQFHDEYEALGYGGHYGLVNRPRRGEGAGCTAYATAYLDVGGLILPEMRSRWTKTIRVPVDMIGGGEAGTPKKRVSFFRLLLAPWRNWATPEQDHREVFFWDPDAMNAWVGEVFDSDRTDFERVSLGKSRGLVWDARSVPTPADPIWQ